jgi:hypothetical protein
MRNYHYIMRIDKYLLFCTLFLLIIIVSHAFPVAFEEKKPRDEKAVLVPKGARPLLKEEYPRRQLEVDRIKARHTHVLVIPFARSWNTAALTAMNAVRIEEEPEMEPNDFELGFALHSQRLRIGALRNREYFQKETEGFPEGWYRPLNSLDHIDRPEGYMTTTFVHLAARRIRRKYTDYRDFSDRLNGILNVIMTENRQLTMMARRDMQSYRVEGMIPQPRVRNTAGMSYTFPNEEPNKLTIGGSSVWSTLTDSAGRDFRYISGIGSVALFREMRPDFQVDLKGRLQISTFRDQTDPKNTDVLETRRAALLDVSNIILPVQFLKFKLNVSGLYDSEYEDEGDLYKFYFMPGAELALESKAAQLAAGVRKRAILPDRDELYWSAKSIKVNDDLQPENFWEAYSLLNINLIARLRLLAEASYSRPESRVTWNQLPGYVWEPVNVETSQALTGQAFMVLDIIRSLGIYGSFRYQHFDNQMFDPEITADAGLYYGDLIGGNITLGGSFWNFQPLEGTDQPENLIFAYGRFNKSIRRVINIFVDGRYAINREDLVYYRGMPQAGRIISLGANVVFGGLD